ncbi:MAG: hypothetical protein HA495_00210 [Thaumarchaeota archaeon]|nr:hypothetical protein [Nitrososphaerota archaeon]
MKKYSLIGEPDICRGGRLKSIAYCCNKNCIFFKIALKKLGLSYKNYIEVKKKHDKIVGLENNKVVHLAFSRSLETRDDMRDKALKVVGWSPTDYYEYKKKILEALIPLVKHPEALDERIVKAFNLDLFDMNEKKSYKATALGSLEARILSIKKVVEQDDNVQNELGEMDYVGVRVPREMLEEIDKMISKGFLGSRSDAIRLGLQTVIRAFKTLTSERESEKEKSL